MAPQSADKIHAVLDPANIPVIAGTAVTKTDYTNRLSYSIDGGTTSEFAACGPALKAAGVTKTATVSLDLAASLALVPLTDTGVKGAGLTSSGVIVKIPITATDYAPYVQQLKDSGADGVTMILPSGQALQMLKTIRDQGSNIKVCTPDGTMKAPALTDLGDAASNVVNTGWIPLTTTSNPSVAEFVKDLKAEEDSGDANAALEGMLSSDQQGWVGPRIIERLSKTIDGDITGAKLIAALNASSSLNADQFGTIDFTKPGKLQPSLRNTKVYITKWDPATKERVLLQDGPVDVGAFL
ncbi:ABC transporter substrate-binding protein [Arthrobacter sp. MMS18-M83]|uniref:ABC transporter substrate-binding protein n=1 Tax=Arthrobacter sp. MMS18-M83 TaxID=2996261 RepID=UPI00227C67A4|nr:ABC transporter substrate-binding protein [Arthrobacter sp. MMS18-M83]WAH97633.1 ABC transporter substrate-binding protein [Arthrobacter sp. MMS18-M83]